MKNMFALLAILLILVSTISFSHAVSADSSQVIGKLAVPYMYQGYTGWCFLNSLSMVLQYYGVRVHAWDVAQAWNLGHDEGPGGNIIQSLIIDQIFLQNYVKSKGLTVDTPVKKSMWNFQFYKNHIDAGEPIILCGLSTFYGIWPTGGHAVVITGYKSNSTGDYLLIHDPSGYFVVGEWKGSTEAQWPYMYAVVPWTKVLAYFENIWNFISMYDIVLHGSPKPPGGSMYLVDEDIRHSGLGNFGQFYLNNALTWTSPSDEKIGGGEEILSDETIWIWPIVANQYSYDVTYTVKVNLTSVTSGQDLFGSVVTRTMSGQGASKYPGFYVDLASLAHVEPGIYNLTISLWAENPDFNIDVPYDVLGPFSLTIASSHAESYLTAFRDAFVFSASYVPMWHMNIGARTSAYLHVSSSSWSWSLYADAYMIDAGGTRYADTGSTGLEFEVNAYNPEGQQIYTSPWKSTDTDGDGVRGDLSGLGGATPSVQSPSYPLTNIPQYIILKMKWRIWDYLLNWGLGGWSESVESAVAQLLPLLPAINTPPSASFEWSPEKCIALETVEFVSTSFDTDGYITDYHWWFGDGYEAFSQNVTHEYSRAGNYNVTLQVVDNDSLSNSVSNIIPVIIPATTEIRPSTLNLRSNGLWITAHVEFPQDYSVRDINVSSILLNNTVSAEPRPVTVEDFDTYGIPHLMVKFSRADVTEYILDSGTVTHGFLFVTLTITGYLNDGTLFQGSNTIRIINPACCLTLMHWKAIYLAKLGMATE